MKNLVECRKLEAKFRQLAVSDPTKRFLWLAEAEKWEREAEAEIASHFEAGNAVRPVQSSQSPQNLVHAPEGGAGSERSRAQDAYAVEQDTERLQRKTSLPALSTTS
jgi:hypothetical protein